MRAAAAITATLTLCPWSAALAQQFVETSTAAVASPRQEAAPASEPGEQAETQTDPPVEAQAAPQQDEVSYLDLEDRGIRGGRLDVEARARRN